ncbi:PAAR domain-containing protein [Photorhabdus asymbiotica]|uniref:PAAR domain-containing protein n=1 Tax=Photorhabdus asymbiotica TaxID=291112 RepID=UPI003DA6D86B
MNDIICIGDNTPHGGRVISGSLVMKLERMSVSAFCGKGIPVAFHGYRCVCGCVLLFSMLDVTAS